jgi:putative Mg2+ transporter-C (MgtC) family protein
MILPMIVQISLPGTDPDFLTAVLRLLAAAAVGGAIGVNRELTRKPAGLRTHSLVALGCALIVVTSNHLGSHNPGDSTSRVIQGVIAGIGFLGGGVILHAEGRTVKGLTTAATIWGAAAAGIACGVGQWLIALTAVVLALLVLTGGQWVEDALHRMKGDQPESGSSSSKV